MKTVTVEVELTPDQVRFLKQLVVNDKNEFEWEIDDYDMWNRLLSYGIVNEITLHYKRYKLLTNMGKQIKNLLENE